MGPYVLATDILRNSKRHNMLDNLYAHLFQKSQNKQIVAIIGGSNCCTWSIRLHSPQKDGSPGHPLRGRHEPECWGLPGLTGQEQRKTDDDSTLLLRMFYIYHTARVANTDPLFLLEHPEDPETHSTHPPAEQAATYGSQNSCWNSPNSTASPGSHSHNATWASPAAPN